MKKIFLLLIIAINAVVCVGQSSDIDSFFERGCNYLQKGRCDLALPEFESIIFSYQDDINNDLDIVYSLASLSAYIQGEYEKALTYNLKIQGINELSVDLALQLLNMRLELLDPKRDDQKQIDETIFHLCDYLYDNSLSDYKKLDIIGQLTSYFVDAKNWEKALDFKDIIGSLSIDESVLSEMDFRANRIVQNTIYMNLGEAAANHLDHHNAIKYYEKSLEFITPEISHNCSPIYFKLANEYAAIGQESKSLEYRKKSIAGVDSQEQEYDFEYDDLYQAKQSMALGAEYISNQMYDEALDALLKADEYFVANGILDLHAYSISHLYEVCNILGLNDKQKEYASEIEKLYYESSIKDLEIKAILANTFASVLSERNEYDKAVEIYLNSLVHTDANTQTCNHNNYVTYHNLASLFQKIGNYNESLKYADLAYKSIDQYEGFYNDKVEIMTIKAKNLVEMGNIGLAASICENVYSSIDESEVGMDTLSNLYSLMGEIYGQLHDYERALYFDEKSIDITKEIRGTNTLAYATMLLNLSETLKVVGEIDRSIECINEAREIIIYLVGKENALYYQSLIKLANRYGLLNDSQKALILYRESEPICKTIYGTKSPQYADLLISMAKLSSNLDNYSIAFLEQGLDILRELQLDNTINYFFDLYMLSSYYLETRDYEKLYAIDKEHLMKVRKYIHDNFTNLIEAQREGLWTRLAHSIETIPDDALFYGNPAFNKLAYNSLLLRKGLLLTSTNEINEVLGNSTDPKVIALLSQLKEQRLDLNNYTDDIYYIKKQELDAIERQLLEYAKEHGLSLDFINLDWTDIKNNLEEGEVAIEISKVRTGDVNSYIAILVSYWLDYPTIVPLFNDSEFDAVRLNSKEDKHKMIFDYGNPRLYHIVWNILEGFLVNVKTIYISPDGILHTLAFEHTRDANGKLASEKWDIRRLSSTRELVKKGSSRHVDDAILYGGLKYEIDEDELINESRQNNAVRHMATRAVEMSDLRNGVDDLPKTQVEVDSIADNFFKCNLSSRTITDIYGTEESFKALDNQSPSIIHLATHGFFWSADKAKRHDYIKVMASSLDTGISDEEQALIRSGLLFSGANIALKGIPLPDDVEDGILTAKELSEMNLGNVDLVVMSACQSGLGETTGEGVFGLQRGFKLSGANSLLMSLWKVNDDATCLLMTEFYKHLLSGKSKCESLRLAQMTLRNHPRCSAPEYWAAFILLDALN